VVISAFNEQFPNLITFSLQEILVFTLRYLIFLFNPIILIVFLRLISELIMTTQCQPTNKCTFPTSVQDLKQEKEFAALAKALAHPARVRILKILSTLEKSGGCLNSDLVSELGLAQSTVSEHLRVLKQVGFITAESIPPKMCYRINRECITQFDHLTNQILM
jgi:DNA-binding transcriptional ArsR family regulator